MTPYQQYIALSRYARFNEGAQRRETWFESSARTIGFWANRFPEVVTPELQRELFIAMAEQLEVMPSMRTVMTAGPALDRDNVAGYNCSATAIQGIGRVVHLDHRSLRDAGFDAPLAVQIRHPVVFDNIMYILLCGTGVGFSVERQFVNELPRLQSAVSRQIYRSEWFPGVNPSELSTFDLSKNTIRVHDSKYGWASALRILIVELYNGNFSVDWDLSTIRPEGAPLKTFGGRASGPGPLDELFRFTVDLFRHANGPRLTSIECHDLVCKIASVIVVGGVRRSALISLSNLSDDRMRTAKTGAWWNSEPHRALANNSAVYTERPSAEIFLKEWQTLIESKSGERGIINRAAFQRAAEAIGRDSTPNFLTNPCGEICLRPDQFCNLSEVVVRPQDDVEDLERKVRLATIFGTLQSTLTDFVYLPDIWKKNCDEERLLGVSLTGINDHPLLSAVPINRRAELTDLLSHLRRYAWEINAEYADMLGINPSKAITCVKPSGTVSQLVDAASGIHPRYAPYYIRRVRSDIKDPLTKSMIAQGFIAEPDVTNPSNTVFSFPIKSPESSVLRDDRTALQQLEQWLIYKHAWCDHNPSASIYVRDSEWLQVGSWVYDHFDHIGGLSFFPHTNHIYRQAPYEEIDAETYHQMLDRTPDAINLTMLSQLETPESVTIRHELACSGGSCELD